MNLLSTGIVLADETITIKGLVGAIEELGSSMVHAAFVLGVAICVAACVAALVTRSKARRSTTTDPLPPTALLRGHTGDAISLAFSPDGKMLATASNDNVVKIWDLTRIDGLILPSPLTDEKRSPVGIVERKG
jgi:hypothetical protein